MSDHDAAPPPLLTRFTSNIRRPHGLVAGVRAEFFCFNGPDADAVLILGRTDLQDALVRVALTRDGEHYGDFDAYIRRPVPKLLGMVANFYADNGVNADRITALGLSKFVDLAVMVDVHQLQTPDGAKASAATATSAVDKPARKPVGPHTAASSLLWSSMFLGQPQVLFALGVIDGPKVIGGGAEGARAARKDGWARLRQLAAVESMADADPAVIRAWAVENGVSVFLPKGYP
ncbi:hypothetical protein [Nevskia sp.]|uniref:hypothetical protein n=1 Tax=Nevskia sp. TaxID=1929292 RepID=UPI0025D47044|nr:hypothetical protein [Nevskia sp.]